MKNGLTIKDATERWVHEMNAIPTGMIEKMMEVDMDDWREITLPSVGDQVYTYSYVLADEVCFIESKSTSNGGSEPKAKASTKKANVDVATDDDDLPF